MQMILLLENNQIATKITKEICCKINYLKNISFVPILFKTQRPYN